METSSVIYKTNEDNTARFLLGETGYNPLVVIGINPSTATDTQPDATIRRVKSFAKSRGFGSWLMLNVYPLRATDPKHLPETRDFALHQQNVDAIRAFFINANSVKVWCAWGTLIDSRPYLRDCMRGIFQALPNADYVHAGDLTKSGHPRHPLYLKGDAPFSEFNIIDYLNQ